MACVFDDHELQLLDRIPELKYAGEMARLHSVIPTLQQRQSITAIIVSYVTEHGRKLHGSYAADCFALKQHPDLVVTPDVLQFYSPHPIDDIVGVCNKLHECGFQYIQGRETMIPNVFTISVEYTRVCEITYLPPMVFGNYKLSKMYQNVTHEELLYMEFLSQWSDMFTSYLHLERFLPRMLHVKNAWLSGFHIADQPTMRATNKDVDAIILAKVIEWGAKNCATIATVGDHARGFFLGKAFPEIDVNVKEYYFVSTNYLDDVHSLTEFLKAEGVGLEILHYHRLSNLLGKRTVFMNKDGYQVFLTIIDSDGRAVPVIDRAPDGLMVAAMPYSLLKTLALRLNATLSDKHKAAKLLECCAHDIVLSCNIIRQTNGTGPASNDCVAREVNLAYIGAPRRTNMMHIGRYHRRALLRFHPKDDPNVILANASKYLIEYDGTRVKKKRYQ
jgi:hypothetical protein